MKRRSEEELVDEASGVPSKRQKGKEKDIGRADWTETQRAYLVLLLVEFGAKEFRTDNGWNNRAWNTIFLKWTEKFPNANYTRTQVKDQEQHLKKKFKSLKQLMTSSGLGWNNELKMVEAVDGVWEDILKNNKEARQWHNKSFPYYDDLYNLYQGCIAEGLLKRGSNQYCSATDFELPCRTPSPTIHSLDESARFPWEDEFINSSTFTANEDPAPHSVVGEFEQPPIIDLSSEIPLETPLPQTALPRISPSLRSTRPTSSSQDGQSSRVARNKKVNTKAMPFSPFNEDYFAFKREEATMYICAMKEMKEKKGNDKYGMSAAMKAFEELEGFTFDDYNKATSFFMSSIDFREAFLTFDSVRRSLWIRKKIDDS